MTEDERGWLAAGLAEAVQRVAGWPVWKRRLQRAIDRRDAPAAAKGEESG